MQHGLHVMTFLQSELNAQGCFSRIGQMPWPSCYRPVAFPLRWFLSRAVLRCLTGVPLDASEWHVHRALDATEWHS